MSLDFAHGAIQWLTTDALNTTYTVSGLSFQPKALRFYWVGLQSATDAASEAFSGARDVGFAVSTASRRCIGTFSQDAAGSANCGGFAANDCVVGTVDGAGNRDGELDLNAINSDGFQLIVDDVPTQSITVFWEVWGGADITVAVVGDIAEPAATGNVDYTATGFVAGATDQVVMFAGCQSTAAVNTGAATDSGLCAGFASSGAAADNVVMTGNSDDGSATMDTDNYALDGECLAMIVVAGGNPNARAQLTQFGTDNFRLNWIARGLTSRRYAFLAIKGGSWKVGSYTINGTAVGNTATVSGLAFAPKGLCLVGRGLDENTAGTAFQTGDIMGFGTGTSTTSRRSMGVWDENGTANAEIDHAIEYDQVLVLPSNAGGIGSAYDLNAMNSDGFQIIVDDAGNTATEWQGYLTFGDAPAAGTTVSAPTRTHSYSPLAPKVSAQVKPAQVTHTYTAQTPKIVHTVRPAQATHTYTVIAPQVQARVQPGAATHSYSGLVPVVSVRTNVRPDPVQHQYTMLTPQARVSVAPAVANHVYSMQSSQVRASVSAAAVSHSYVAQTPQARASVMPAQVLHSYSMQSPQAQSRVSPGAVSHVYTQQAPQVRASVFVPLLTHSYTGQVPAIATGAFVSPAPATHIYDALSPQAKAEVSVGTATHVYTAQLSKVSAQVKPAQAAHTYIVQTPKVNVRVELPQVTHIYTAQALKVSVSVKPNPVVHSYTALVPTVSVVVVDPGSIGVVCALSDGVVIKAESSESELVSGVAADSLVVSSAELDESKVVADQSDGLVTKTTLTEHPE